MYKTAIIKLNPYNNFYKSRYISNYYKTHKGYKDAYLNSQGVEIHGPLRHHPPAIREWNNSVYNFNKHNQGQYLPRYTALDRLLRGYFNINNKIKLARSKRMRYLRVKSSSKRVYISKPEVKQTSDRINITVYYFDKLRNNFSRKLFFYNRPQIASKLIKMKESKKNIKVLLTRTLNMNRHVSLSGVKYIKELKILKDRNQDTTRYIQQKLSLYFFKYIFSMLNIYLYDPIPFYYHLTNLMKKYKYKFIKEDWKLNDILKLNYKIILEKEKNKLGKLAVSNPNSIMFMDYTQSALEKVEKNALNNNYLIMRLTNHHKNNLNNAIKRRYKNVNESMKFTYEINVKLWKIIKNFLMRDIMSNNIVLKTLNFLTLKLNKFVTGHIFKKRNKRIYKMVSLNHNNLIKMKKLLPGLKIWIDNLFNKKAILNMVNLKYFYLDNDVYNKAIITKFRKKKSPLKTLDRSISNMKVFLNQGLKKEFRLDKIDRLYDCNNLSIRKLPLELLKRLAPHVKHTKNIYNKDWLQNVFNKLYPYKFIHKYLDFFEDKKIRNVMESIKYRNIVGIRVEARGRLTRRNTAARAKSLIVYKGNLKDVNRYVLPGTPTQLMPVLLLRNSQRPNTKYAFNSSKRRIGAFGLRTWISGK